jgi:hypothetical protein
MRLMLLLNTPNTLLLLLLLLLPPALLVSVCSTARGFSAAATQPTSYCCSTAAHKPSVFVRLDGNALHIQLGLTGA